MCEISQKQPQIFPIPAHVPLFSVATDSFHTEVAFILQPSTPLHFVWRIPLTEDPGGYSPVGSGCRVGHD